MQGFHVPLDYSITGKHAADMAFARIALRTGNWGFQKPFFYALHGSTDPEERTV